MKGSVRSRFADPRKRQMKIDLKLKFSLPGKKASPEKASPPPAAGRKKPAAAARKGSGIKNPEKIAAGVFGLALIVVVGLLVVRLLSVGEVGEEGAGRMEKFTVPPAREKEFAEEEKLIDELQKPETLTSYKGLMKRDSFTEFGRIDAGADAGGFLSLSLNYVGNMRNPEGENLAQINWQDGNKLRTFFVRTGESMNDFKVLEIVPKQQVKVRTPEGEEIVLDYKKERKIEPGIEQKMEPKVEPPAPAEDKTGTPVPGI